MVLYRSGNLFGIVEHGHDELLIFHAHRPEKVGGEARTYNVIFGQLIAYFLFFIYLKI